MYNTHSTQTVHNDTVENTYKHIPHSTTIHTVHMYYPCSTNNSGWAYIRTATQSHDTHDTARAAFGMSELPLGT